ncbi:MAG: penicillin-binding protein 1C [Melioribacteraceae bacterium]|nr:MAG: penicillin-binding protein 1C [Melioribacteraceae bacterium]
MEKIDFGKQVYSADSLLLSASLNGTDKWRLRSRLEDIHPQFLRTIIYKEDKWFYYHPGVNPVAIARAFYQNITTGRRVSGASTITMQLARLLEPKERTLISKLVEVFRAFQLELKYSKDEILSAYTNLLPYGGNIEGVKAASLKYFNRLPVKLSISQSVILSIIPNNPNKLRPGKSNLKLKIERDEWLTNLWKDQKITEQEYRNALDENITTEIYAIPNEAAHLSRRLMNENKSDIIYSTIERNKQKRVGAILKNYISAINSKGIFNGAILVVENNTGKVKVYCGSQNFSDKFHGGEVDGITAVRSPGSALKPILYAELIDNFGITPKRKISDIPTDFGGYSPDNFDELFNGPVTIEYALKNSLNVPAVKLLNEIGTGVFIRKLEDGGFESVKNQKESLGLSMILGGCGTTLSELSRYYAAFGNYGMIPELVFHDGEFPGGSKRVVSAESAYLLFKMLSSIERPDFPNEFLAETKLPPIAWKTGTSYGRRDAWAIGFNKGYTIGVWIGNFKGTGSPFLTGAEIAVPLLFEVANYILYGRQDLSPEQPDKVKIRKVCAESGKVPGRFCGSLINDYYIEGVSSIEKCDIETEIFVDSSGSVLYCTSCLPADGYKRKIVNRYSPEIRLWLQRNGAITDIPKHNPDCTRIEAGNNLRIVSPVKDYEYIFTNPGEESISLKAASGNGKYLYWFIDGKFTGKVKSGDVMFLKPKSGNIEVVCVDDLGNTDKVKIVVKEY